MSAQPRLQRRRRRPEILPYLLLLPTGLFVALFTAWPTLLSLYQSFFRQRLNIAKFRDPTFIGLDNYFKIFDPSGHALAAMGRTLKFVFI